MPPIKSSGSLPASRTEDTRRRVLGAAERLLRASQAGFTMRDLAAEAGVSFATPFNQFGSKGAILQALSAQRIAAMGERYRAAAPGGDAADRTLVAVDIATDVMLAEPAVNRALIGHLGTPDGEAGQVLAASVALWTEALGACDGVDPAAVALARSVLPGQLAVSFRGVLSFWAAGEIEDRHLATRARSAAVLTLAGLLRPERRTLLLGTLAPES